jgi:Fe-S cluster assembly protein SufD
LARAMSFLNLQKAMTAAKAASASWFSKISHQSFDHEMDDLLSQYSWPTPKLESWKYTNVTKLAEVEYLPPQIKAPKVLPAQLSSILTADFEARIVFFNGRYAAELSHLSKDSRISFQHFAASTKETQDFKLTCHSEVEKMNQLLITDVLRLEIQKSAVIEKPIAVVFLADMLESQVQASRLQFILAPNSQAHILEIHSGVESNSKTLSNHMAEFKIEDSAHLEHSFLNLRPKGSTSFLVKKFQMARASFLRSLHIDLGGGLSRTETYVDLNESGAEAFVNGLYLSNEKQHTDHQGIIRHIAPETISHQMFKGILADQSRAIFNAKIRIEQTAPKSSAQQLNKNLLLSEKAEVDSLPRLEILNDDVKATHGSTSGQIDPAQVFYLQSRAISKDQAMQMLIEGYALESLEGTHQMIASLIEKFISDKLNGFLSRASLAKEVDK